MGDLEVHHKGTDEMWGDINTKPLQGTKFRVMRAVVMGILADYDDDRERRRTHPLLMPKEESDIISATDNKILQKEEIIRKKQRVPLRPSKLHPNKQTKGIPRGINKVFLQSRANTVKPAMNRRSVLGVSKYGPGLGPHWRNKTARLPALTKFLMD